jgi:hypothetical protein
MTLQKLFVDQLVHTETPCVGRVTRVHSSPRAKAVDIYTNAYVSGAILRYIGLRRYSCDLSSRKATRDFAVIYGPINAIIERYA